MRIGVPKELKNSERRVALTPAGVAALVAKGHEVFVESEAGLGSGFLDSEYIEVGATLCWVQDVWSFSEMIVKVKEPILEDRRLIKKEQVIFTYLHLAADDHLTGELLKSGATCIAYETVELSNRELPLLTPMSEVAGRMAPQKGAQYMPMLLGGVPGVAPASVVILGGGVVGANAAEVAAGLGASVVILDTSLPRLRDLAKVMPPNVQTVFSTRHTILQHIALADLVIGAVLVHGAKAPKLILKDDLRLMKPGAMIVDVAVDQGGCVETTRPTTHESPVYEVDGIMHYGVANMPGAVPRTSTLALTNATLPYILSIADNGWKEALKKDAALRKGLNICDGHIACLGVADAFNMPYVEPDVLINI